MSRFTRSATSSAAGSTPSDVQGETSDEDHIDEDGLDAYGRAVLAEMADLPPDGGVGDREDTVEGGAFHGSIQQQADRLFEQRMAQMDAEADSDGEDAGLPPSLLGLSTTLSELQDGNWLTLLDDAWPQELPAQDAKSAPALVQQHESAGVELCKRLLPQLATFASAISTAAAHISSHTYGSALGDTARLTIESSLTLRRRLVRRLIRPLDASSLATRVFLSQCVLAAASIPLPTLQPHANALTSPGKGSAQASGRAADPVRDASALAARHLFVCSKCSALDSLFRESGSLGVILDVLRSGCDTQDSASHGSASEPRTPQKKSSLPRVAAGSGSVTSRQKLNLPAAFNFESCPAQGSELTYLLGVLKNVSHSTENANWLVTQGALPIVVSVLEGVTCGGGAFAEGGGDAALAAGGSGDAKHLGQVAVQATGVLRNLCLAKRHMQRVWASGAVDALLRVLPRMRRHQELGLNVARILAKLTLHEPARARFVAVPAYVGALLELVSMSPSRAPAALVVRVMFSLGNLTATNDATRQRLGRHPDVLPALSALIQSHTKLLVANLGTAAGAAAGGAAVGALNKPAAEAADVLVKTCRTAAHLGIDDSIALQMLQCEAVGASLGNLLQALPATLPDGLVELALNALSVVTNLAFHSNTCEAAVNCLVQQASTIAPSLVKLMHSEHDDVVLQAVRTAANLCRRPSTRDAVSACAAGGMVSAAVVLLHHRRRDAAITACGLLMNIALTPAGGQAVSFTCLREEGGGSQEPVSAVAALTQVVEAAYWGGDVEFSTAAAQVLFNHCLGWDASPVEEQGRLTDDEALGLLAVIDGVTADAAERVPDESGGKSDEEAACEDSRPDPAALSAVVDVLSRLKQDVRSMVDQGKVADHEERFHTLSAKGKQ